MPTKLSKSGQTLFDIVLEGFGNLDNLVAVSFDNGIALSDQIPANTSLVINNENLGNSNIKQVISNDGLEFNNAVIFVDYLTVDDNNYLADNDALTIDTTDESIAPPAPEYASGVIAFDGVDDEIVFGSVPDIQGTKTITFKLYLTAAFTLGLTIIHIKESGSSEGLNILYGSSTIRAYGALGIGTNAKSYSVISGIPAAGEIAINTVYDCEIIKIGNDIDSFKLNSVDTSSNSFTALGATQNKFGIGSTGDSLNFGKDFSIWDININGEHAYSGQPSGELDSAWEDTIGSIDGTVNGSPSTVNIEI